MATFCSFCKENEKNMQKIVCITPLCCQCRAFGHLKRFYSFTLKEKLYTNGCKELRTDLKKIFANQNGIQLRKVS